MYHSLHQGLEWSHPVGNRVERREGEHKVCGGKFPMLMSKLELRCPIVNHIIWVARNLVTCWHTWDSQGDFCPWEKMDHSKQWLDDAVSSISPHWKHRKSPGLILISHVSSPPCTDIAQPSIFCPFCEKDAKDIVIIIRHTFSIFFSISQHWISFCASSVSLSIRSRRLFQHSCSRIIMFKVWVS